MKPAKPAPRKPVTPEGPYELAPVDSIVVPPRVRRVREGAVDDLVASINELGLLNPLVVHKSNAGLELVCGAHRLEAVRRLGWPSVPVLTITGDKNCLLLAEVAENLARSELSEAERLQHEMVWKETYEAAHPQTRHGGRRKQVAKDGDMPTPRPTAVLARMSGRSERDVQRDFTRGKVLRIMLYRIAHTCLDLAPEIAALAVLPFREREALVRRAEAGERVTAKTAAKQMLRDAKEWALAERTAEVSAAIGTQLYGVLLADPPWRFEPRSRETGMDRAADNHYPTADVDEISALEVPAAPDCVLFLWATVPMFVEALMVMESGGSLTGRKLCGQRTSWALGFGLGISTSTY